MNPLARLELPRLKLAGTYLAIIMGMSIIFSFAIYNLSDHELQSQRRLQIPQNIQVTFSDDFERLQQLRLDQARSNLRERLAVFNLITLFFGAILSYVLALRALQPIEDIIEAQDRFTSDASHEIRTPLTVMKSEIEVALRDKNLTLEEAKETMASNLEEVTKLEALTSGLLQLARQENTQITKQKIDINELIKNSREQVLPKAKAKNIKITLGKVKGPPLSGEPQSLQQALVILLDNSIKYSPTKSEIQVTPKNNRSSYSISIQDQGPGIDAEDLPHIFERFYRSDKSRTKAQETSGYGLGLAIAKQIIDSHSGTISISSKPNKGTTATINLPKK